MDFRFTVELDASVITPNGTYTTGSDGGAGFLGWTGSSSIGNGFSANGTLKHVSGTKSHLGFSFDENGVINGIYTTEHTANDPLEPSEDDTVDFSVPGAGKITWSETQQVVSRADQACPPDPPGHFCVNNKPIKGEWHKVGGPGG